MSGDWGERIAVGVGRGWKTKENERAGERWGDCLSKWKRRRLLLLLLLLLYWGLWSR